MTFSGQSEKTTEALLYTQGWSSPSTAPELSFLEEFALEGVTLYVLIAVDGIGVIENLFVFLLFLQLRRKQLLTPTAHLMLGQQTFFDALSCGLAILVSLDPFKLISLNGTWNILLCHIWKTQFIYFLAYLYAVYNHCIISSERLIAIVYSLHYSRLKNKLWIILVSFYLIMFAYNFPGLFRMNYDFETNTCERTQEYNQIVQPIDVYNVSTIFFQFLLPLLIMGVTNIMVVFRLKRESKAMQKFGGMHESAAQSSMHGPNKITEANRALVKISVSLAISFISTSIFANIFLFLSALDLITIPQFSPLGNLTILSANINMTINPILCIVCLPSLRRSITTWFTSKPSQNFW